MLDGADLRFSRRGDPPSIFEIALLAKADNRSPLVMIGQRISAHNLAVLLDELGGEKVHIPTRQHFYEGLWLPHRDAEIHKLVVVEKVQRTEVAKRYGITPAAVWAALNRTTRNGLA